MEEQRLHELSIRILVDEMEEDSNMVFIHCPILRERHLNDRQYMDLSELHVDPRTRMNDDDEPYVVSDITSLAYCGHRYAPLDMVSLEHTDIPQHLYGPCALLFYKWNHTPSTAHALPFIGLQVYRHTLSDEEELLPGVIVPDWRFTRRDTSPVRVSNDQITSMAREFLSIQSQASQPNVSISNEHEECNTERCEEGTTERWNQ